MLHIVNEEIRNYLGQLERQDPKNNFMRAEQIKKQNQKAKLLQKEKKKQEQLKLAFNPFSGDKDSAKMRKRMSRMIPPSLRARRENSGSPFTSSNDLRNAANSSNSNRNLEAIKRNSNQKYETNQEFGIIDEEEDSVEERGGEQGTI